MHKKNEALFVIFGSNASGGAVVRKNGINYIGAETLLRLAGGNPDSPSDVDRVGKMYSEYMAAHVVGFVQLGQANVHLFKRPRFELGALSMTAEVAHLIDQNVFGGIHMTAAVMKHAIGVWGELGQEDKQANDEAVVSGDRIVSRHAIGGRPVYVITEYDRSYTTVMLTSEY